MKIYYYTIMIVFIGLMLVNCDSNSTDPKDVVQLNVPDNVVGTWDALSYLIVNNADTSEYVELVQLGYGLSITFQSYGSYSSTLTSPTDPDYTETGNINFVSNTVTVDPSTDDPFIMTYVIVDDTLLTFIDPNSTFDFDDDNIDEDVTETIVLLKQ